MTKTGEHILMVMFEQMAELDIQPSDLHNVTFVTDQATNMKKALEQHKRLPCIMHCINTALKHTFKEEFIFENVPAIFHFIQAVRKVVGYMKRSGLVTRLEKTLVPDIETRWNSMYLMLQSFHPQREQIETILKDVNKQELMTVS